MAKQPPYLMEDPKKFYKPNREYTNNNNYYYKAKGMYFFASIFSVFIYISIFYIFNLSPSTLFYNAKFWFLISNTLILIIAADYGAFSSSNDNSRDAYDEYMITRSRSETTRQSTSAPSSFLSEKRQQDQPDDLMQEKKEDREKKNETPERNLQMVVKNDKVLNDTTTAAAEEGEDIQVKTIVVCHEENKSTKKQEARRTHHYRRSKSQKVKRVVMEFDESAYYNDNIMKKKKNSSGHVLRRSGTENMDHGSYVSKDYYYDHVVDDDHDDVSEFYSTMSDEELNRRVEEFIQRFNRQIRLQAQFYNDNN
ncbi:uncharacterized protein LOC133800477 [Humulus lupulus]|uniref:uncharacterized protein LOC133800477 n=1 Tax=Humulus lupulus TaxID=3486 RepID=UPI002B40A219|nr:uncharacterized protein LOC133800477 [Humulus lupulus]